MGTAGLDVERLQGLLERQKVDSVLLEGDHAQDHVILELSSVRRPNLVARLEYENYGFEPRLASLSISTIGTLSENSLPNSQTIHISGRRDDDVEKIVQFVRESFVENELSLDFRE